MKPDPTQARQLLRQMFDAAVASAQPARCIAAHLPDPKTISDGHLVVIGAGKASAAMAAEVEKNWAGPLRGLVVTRYGYAVRCEHIDIVQAAHPVPDAAGLQAAKQMLALAHSLTAQDHVLCLMSGGGSSLLPMPIDGLTLQDKQDVNRALLKSGATIGEMNRVRRHLSGIKGGRLAAACHPASVLNLLISDVPGDNPIDIASGPTVTDPTTCEDALAIIDHYRIDISHSVRDVLQSGRGESVSPGDARLAGVQTRIIAAPQIALEAAAQVAREAGVTPYILGDALEGEARDVGKVLAGIAGQTARRGQPFSAPCVLLSGGETTVTVRGSGRGGRNVECLLAMGITLDGLALDAGTQHKPAQIYAIACDTDGVDGLDEIAGAIITPDTMSRARASGLRATHSLANNDGHGFFEALGDSVVTGPTLTNVNDFRAILIA